MRACEHGSVTKMTAAGREGTKAPRFQKFDKSVAQRRPRSVAVVETLNAKKATLKRKVLKELP